MSILQLSFVACLVLSGLAAGIFLGSQIAQVPMQKAASASQFIYLKHHTELCYGPIMPWLMIAATLLHVPVLYFIRDGKTTAFYLTMGSFAIWFSIDLLTWLINFPVNKQAAKWNPSQPPVANWSALRDRWHLGQTLRTYLAIPAFAMLQLALFFTKLS